MYSPMELTLTGLTSALNHKVLAIASGKLAPQEAACQAANASSAPPFAAPASTGSGARSVAGAGSPVPLVRLTRRTQLKHRLLPDRGGRRFTWAGPGGCARPPGHHRERRRRLSGPGP